MEKFNRHRQILELAAQEGGVSVKAVAGLLGACRMTIRRDLRELAEAGQVKRVRGGATPLATEVVSFEFTRKRHLHGPEKLAIARAVARLVQPGMAVSLDTGTTTLAVARGLIGIRGLTVLTSSLAIASALYHNPGCELVLLGGSPRRGSPDLTGPLTEDNLKRFRVHLAVVGADAVTPEGTFAADPGVCRICRAMAASAERTVVVADSSKFGATGFVHCLKLDQIDHLVTDDGCPPAVQAWLREGVKQVTCAQAFRPVLRQEVADAR